MPDHRQEYIICKDGFIDIVLDYNEIQEINSNRIVTSSSPHLQHRDECHAEAMPRHHLPFQCTSSVLQHPVDL